MCGAPPLCVPPLRAPENNLHELWALLNFIHPDWFPSADRFDAAFTLDGPRGGGGGGGM